MNGPQHYKEAEELLAYVAENPNEEDEPYLQLVAVTAQVHATLALAAATADQTVARGPGDVGPGWLEVLK